MGNITLKLLGDSQTNCTDLVYCCGCSEVHSVSKYHTIAYILALLAQEFILSDIKTLMNNVFHLFSYILSKL